MHQINLETWPRRDHFEVFSNWDYPHFSLCANVDITTFYPAIKRRGVSLTVAVMYALARVANAIPEFRYRIRENGAVEHDVVHPSTTILKKDNLFTFCTVHYIDDFSLFSSRAKEQITHVKENPTLEDEPGEDDLLFMTSIPWVSFTSFMHPLKLYPADSVPRFAWGKFFKVGEILKMPLSVQGHHAVMDGLHVGKFYEELQVYLYHPDDLLS